MKKILVIEDEEFVRDNISDVLQIEGFRPILADSGKTGLEILETENIDLILCDITMPEMDGYQVLEEIKENEDYMHIPFVFLTARAENHDMRKGMAMGADDYIHKPFKTKDLINAVNARLHFYEKTKNISNAKLDELRIQLASTLPHEFRTPLNVILATSQFLEKKMDMMEKDEIKDMISNIVSSGNRLSKLISNYLIYSNLVINKDNLSFNDKAFTNYTIDPEDIIENSFVNAANEYEREDDLKMKLESGVLDVYPEYFLKISEELATNAFKFSKEGTPVVVEVKVDEDHYHLRVRDEGVGIDISKIDDIGGFNQFGRQELEQQGMGLGLAIIKLISERFDIDLDIDSVKDDHTEFNLAIPLRKDSAYSE